MRNSTSHKDEVKRGRRFEFGLNWRSFLDALDQDRITEAVRSVTELLSLNDLSGKSFLDIGSGSGLFSLSARKLGADVRSFDFDPESVACTIELRRLYFNGDANWEVEEGSVLDREYMRKLGVYDIVFSWGVLHHTGNLVEAMENAIQCVGPGGVFVIALYNDEGVKSSFWKIIKRLYCKNLIYRSLIVCMFFPVYFALAVSKGLVRSGNPISEFSSYKERRGMSLVHDWFDWLGGYPFEVAKPGEILQFFRDRGFELHYLITTNRLGCNQFVFRKR
jgi:SAM-dependent methyltransferase